MMLNNPPWQWTVDQAIEKYEKLKQSDINILKEWLKGETHLPAIPDEQLVLFHHACKYELDKTKETIEKCYIMRTKYKELFSNRDPSHPFIQEIMKVVICTPLRGFDSEGNQVIWIRLNNLSPDRYYFGTSLKAIFMTMDAVQMEAGPVPGYVYVLDGKGFTLSHMLRATITLCRRFIEYSQEGSTFFPKAIHVLNLSTVLEKVVAVIKPFMKSDLFSVITFYKPGKHSELFEHLPASIIPNEYGGTGGALTEIHEEHAQQLVKYKEWFAKEELLRIDETKRPNGLRCAESVCKEEEELETSLKRLEID